MATLTSTGWLGIQFLNTLYIEVYGCYNCSQSEHNARKCSTRLRYIKIKHYVYNVLVLLRKFGPLGVHWMPPNKSLVSKSNSYSEIITTSVCVVDTNSNLPFKLNKANILMPYKKSEVKEPCHFQIHVDCKYDGQHFFNVLSGQQQCV